MRVLVALGGNAMTGPDGSAAPQAQREAIATASHHLAELVVRKTGSRSDIVHMPLPADDPKQRRHDISKAKAVLDWEPAIALDEGLERTIAYFRSLGA